MFKVGDQVVCLRDEPGQFTSGKVYTIIEVLYHNGRQHIRTIDDSGDHNGWGEQFFRPINLNVFNELGD